MWLNLLQVKLIWSQHIQGSSLQNCKICGVAKGVCHEMCLLGAFFAILILQFACLMVI